MSRNKLNLSVLLGAGGFYLLNRLWLARAVRGWPGWFLRCYANDLWAGAAILAWADLLLGWGRLPRLSRPGQVLPLLLACGLVWEVLAPLWKPGAVFDPWDFLAYQLGGLCWLWAAKFFPSR